MAGRSSPKKTVRALVVGAVLVLAVRDASVLLVLNWTIPYYFATSCPRTTGDIMAICTAIETYEIDHDQLPDDLETLVTPDERGYTYLENLTTVPLDPWKHPYVYEPHPDGTYRVISYGEDGMPGGDDIDNVGIREGSASSPCQARPLP